MAVYKAGKEQGGLSDNSLSTTYLKLEPIKVELSITTSWLIDDVDIPSVENTSQSGVQLILTIGNTGFTGLTNGDRLQFCAYDPLTKCETEIFNSKETTFSSSSVVKFTFLGRLLEEQADKLERATKYAKELIKRNDSSHKANTNSYLKAYKLPDNYVTKQIQIGTIQSYWQDPTFDNVMWVQHTSCCSFTTGPFSPTVTAGDGPPTAITQTALVSKAETGTEVFHNIIPLLDTIMTYAN